MNSGGTEALLKGIQAARSPLERAAVCMEAYQTLCGMEEPVELFSWFVETADLAWHHKVKSEYAREREEAQVSKLLKLLREKGIEGKKDGVLTVYGGEEAVPERPKLPASLMSQCKAKFGHMVEGIIDICTMEGGPEAAYYTKLWSMLRTLLDAYTKEEQGACLYFVIFDERIPYWDIEPGVRMDNSEYQRIVKKIKPELRKMLYVLNLPAGQRTETASRLLRVLDELSDFNERTVFLSQLIARIEPDDE